MTLTIGLGLLSDMVTPFSAVLGLATSSFSWIPGHQPYSVQRNTPFTTLEDGPRR
jgi:hypothetical protein